MRHFLASLLILCTLPVHAELDFDKWRFSELIVSGLKSARLGNSEVMSKSLEQLKNQLALLNIEINHLNPNDREAGITMARELLTDPIREAWETERADSHLESQRQFLARLLDLGLSETIENTTEELKKKALNDFSQVTLKNHLSLAGLTGSLLGGSFYAAHVIHDPGPAFLGFFASAMGYMFGTFGFSAYNAWSNFNFKTNFISPVFRECELGLLRRSGKRIEESREGREGGKVSCDV